MEETRRRLTILLAEDNDVNQRVATAILTKRGHTVDTVGTGRDAVAAVSRKAYDLVLMDIEMPEMDGIAATGAIRQDPAFAELPIIAMTAHAAGGEEECYREAGMTDYLTKPFKPQDLVRLVEGIAATTPAARVSVEIRRPPAPVAIEEFRRSLREAGIEETTGAILAVFREDTPRRMADLEAAGDTGDASDIRMAAHAFKSAAATIRALNLAELLQQAESAAEAGERSHATELIPQIREEYGAVMEFLETAA
jgi:CheY-like chemotaxis protein